MDGTERFEALLALGDALPLDQAMLAVAETLRPPVDNAAALAQLDELAASVADPSVEALCAALFGEAGFHGNRDAYYDAENSYLDAVIARRTGIPITLSVLVIEVGRRVGLPLCGVGMPGHFLVGVGERPERFLDAFDGGRLLDSEGCAALLATLGAAPGGFDPAWLEPVSGFEILARVLANLRAIHQQQGDRGALARVLRLRSRVPGVPLDERRHLARVLASVGQFPQAANELEQLAALVPEPAQAELRIQANALRARSN